MSATVFVMRAMVLNMPASLVPSGSHVSSQGKPTNRSGMRSIASATPSMTLAATCVLSDSRVEVLVLQLAAVQPVLDQRGVVAAVGLGDLLRLQQRLPLPVGVAPLVLADRQRQVQQLALVAGAQRRQVLGVSLLERREQRGAELARPGSASSCAFCSRNRKRYGLCSVAASPSSAHEQRHPSVTRAGRRLAAAAGVRSPVGHVDACGRPSRSR